MTAERLEGWYARALQLYPAGFRAAYAGPMRQAFRDALSDGTLERGATLRLAARDLAVSLWRVHVTMAKETFVRPALVFNALVLADMATVLGLALCVIPQQVLRMGANDPQIQMATDLAAKLEAGTTAASAIPTGNVDMAWSLAPFVIVYDDAGRTVAGQVTLEGTIPAPPAGVFDYVRTHSEERVSWQPALGGARGVRIAAVVERVSGAQPGFVLAGRSMREVQVRIDHVQNLAGLTWLGMLGLIMAGTVVFGWVTRKTARLSESFR